MASSEIKVKIDVKPSDAVNHLAEIADAITRFTDEVNSIYSKIGLQVVSDHEQADVQQG